MTDSLDKKIQIISDSAKSIAEIATKHAVRVNAEHERQESKLVEDNKDKLTNKCIAKWIKVL